MVVKLNHISEENNIVEPFSNENYYLESTTKIVEHFVGIVVIPFQKWYMVYP